MSQATVPWRGLPTVARGAAYGPALWQDCYNAEGEDDEEEEVATLAVEEEGVATNGQRVGGIK